MSSDGVVGVMLHFGRDALLDAPDSIGVHNSQNRPFASHIDTGP